MPGYLRHIGAQIRPVLACGHAVRALGTGSCAAAVRAWKWSGKGDVPLRRGGTLLGLAFVAWATVKAPQGMVTTVLVAWCLIAWLSAPETPQEKACPAPGEDDAEAPTEAPVRPVIEDRDALLRWLSEAIGDRNGIHLDELHQRLSQEPGCHTLTRAHITPLLDHHQVPVTRSLSVGRVSGRTGVRRADLQALSPTASHGAADGHSRSDSVPADQQVSR